jgi:hypothetical protein
MKLLTNSENPFSNSLQRLYSREFTEIAYRKPPVILKTVPKAGYGVSLKKIDQ